MTDRQTVDFNYPKVRRDDNHTITFHGVKIKDPYAELILDDEKFIEDQKKYFQKLVRDMPDWEKYRKTLREISNFERKLLPVKVKGKYFYLAITGDKFHHTLYKAESLKDDKPKPVFDMNSIEDKNRVIPTLWSVSPDAKYLVFCYRKFNEHCSSALASKLVDDPPEGSNYLLENRLLVGSDVAWYEEGFFYGSKLKNNKFPLVLYHQNVATDKSKDNVIFQLDSIDLIPSPLISDDKKYLYIFVTSYKEFGTLLYFSRLHKNKTKFYQIVTKWGWFYKFIMNIKHMSYFLTSKKSTRNHIIRIDMHNRKPKCHCEWTKVVSKHATDILWDASFAANNFFILHYMHDASAYIRFYSLKGKKFLQQKIVQQIGMIKLQRSYDPADPEFFYEFESFHIPPRVYRVSIEEMLNDDKPQIVFESKLKDFSPSDFFVDFKTFTSKDNRYEIPLYVIGKQKFKNQPRPCILEAKGGFGKCLWPRFDPYIFAFFDIFRGTRAFVYVRGGYERGRKWWNSGRGKKKYKSIDDFEKACNYLMSSGYTTKNSLILEGQVNGGYIIASAVMKNPQICAIAIPINPLTDMINFVQTCTRDKLIHEYGDPHKDEKILKRLLRYSPYHRIEIPGSDKETYPVIYVVAAQNNLLAPLWHSSKFVANLQYILQGNQFQKSPMLFYTTPEIEFIHGQWNTNEMVDHYADKYVIINTFSATDIGL